MLGACPGTRRWRRSGRAGGRSFLTPGDGSGLTHQRPARRAVEAVTRSGWGLAPLRHAARRRLLLVAGHPDLADGDGLAVALLDPLPGADIVGKWDGLHCSGS